MNYSIGFFLILTLITINITYSNSNVTTKTNITSVRDKSDLNKLFQNSVPFLTNHTFDLAFGDFIDCIAVGDADNDGDNDIVVGTAYLGTVVLFENTGDENNVEFTQKIIANFSSPSYYGVVPVYTPDIVIADLDGTGNNSILVGTAYFDTSWKGDLVSFNKTSGIWQEEEFLNGGSKIIGGVYGISVGAVGPSSENLVVVGQGFEAGLTNCNVTLYKKVLDNWIVENLIQTYQSRICVSIGEFTLDYDGNEILYCSTSSNCSLGYIVYDSVVVYHEIFGGFPGWYNEGFDWMDSGDLNGDGLVEAVVSVKRGLSPDTDAIEIYNGMPNISLYSGFTLIESDFEINDFDNDGKDEVLFINCTTTSYPEMHLMCCNWNGTHTDTYIVETTIDYTVPSIAVGDVDTDGKLETLYGTTTNSYLRLLDWITADFTDEYYIPPMVSLVEGVFNITCTVQTHAWGIQGLSVSLDLPTAINKTAPSTTIYLGNKPGPSTTTVHWVVDPLAYGIYGIDAETTTLNFGMNATTLNAIVTDLEVQNVQSSSLVTEVGTYVTLTGEVEFIHDSFPVEDAEVFIDGTSVAMTDSSGHFSFQHTELSIGLKNHNITASLENGVKITKCAGYKIVQIEWTAAVPEFSNLLYLSFLLPIIAISVRQIIMKKRLKM